MVAAPGVGHLLTEYLAEPVGIDVRAPRFSWQMTATGRGAMQGAYQVQVASAAELLAGDAAHPDVWDSGRVVSGQSVNVEYGGPSLQSRSRYFWRVRLWDNQGGPSDFSPVASFEMGLLGAEEWTGRWITGSATDTSAPLLRREFVLEKPVASARAYVTAAGYYELRINGQKVGDRVLEPAWTSFDRRVLYSTYDVTNLLRTGPNVAGAILGHGWYKGNPRLLFQLNITYTDGTRVSLVTDGSWRTASGPILQNSIYDGETYDARLEQSGWDRPGFDASTWTPVVVTSGPGGVLSAEMIPPIRVVETRQPWG